MRKNEFENCFPITINIYKETIYFYNEVKGPFVNRNNLEACELDPKYISKKVERNLYFENDDQLYNYYKEYLGDNLNKNIEGSYDWETHWPIIRIWDIRLQKYLEQEIRIIPKGTYTLNSLDEFLQFRNYIRRD